MTHAKPHLSQSVLAHARKDFTVLGVGMTVAETLAAIRQRGIGEKIVNSYVVDGEQRLVGVVPTRRLLTASLEQRLSEIMASRVLAIPQTATLLEACELFVLHRFLAFPVVDEQRRVVGVVDVSLFTQEVFDLTEQERMNEVFEAIGFQVSQVREASPWRAFRFRRAVRGHPAIRPRPRRHRAGGPRSGRAGDACRRRRRAAGRGGAAVAPARGHREGAGARGRAG